MNESDAPDPTDASPAPAPLDSLLLRKALGHFCSGITVVAGVVDSKPVGLTCQSFFSLSLDPPLIAIAASKTSTSYPLVRTGERFSVNVLADHQRSVSNALARTGTDKWADINWHLGPHGQPILPGSLLSIECRREAEHDAGDHILVIGRVLDLDYDEHAKPLLYFRGQYHHVATPPIAVTT